MLVLSSLTSSADKTFECVRVVFTDYEGLVGQSRIQTLNILQVRTEQGLAFNQISWKNICVIVKFKSTRLLQDYSESESFRRGIKI